MSTESQIASYFTVKKLIIPVLIGMGTAAYFLLQGFDFEAYKSIKWTSLSAIWLAGALLMVVTRLLGYAYRLIVLSNNALNWKKSLQIIVLWEFSSAISPGIVGGSAAAFILLAKEKNINAGKGTAMVLATSYLDVLFYVLAAPFLWLFVSQAEVIPTHIEQITSTQIVTFFLTAYTLFLGWCIVIYIGLFYKPHVIKKVILWFCKLPFLKRYHAQVNAWGDNMVSAASNFKYEPQSFWFKAFGGTLVAWTSRFLLVNFLILALGNGTEVAAIFAKQIVMWGALMVPITPGATGIAEGLFSGFMGEYLANAQITHTTAFLWRLLSYWPYLFAGTLVFPIWYARVTKKALQDNME